MGEPSRHGIGAHIVRVIATSLHSLDSSISRRKGIHLAQNRYKIEYIEDGLKTFKQFYKEMGITSISFPPLGCGNGNLDWHHVKPLMLKYLWDLDMQIYIHEVDTSKNFLPEHKELYASVPPLTFNEFSLDLRGVVTEHSGSFVNLKTKRPFQVQLLDDLSMEIFSNRKFTLQKEQLVDAWTELCIGMLSMDPHASPLDFLISTIATLPYVRPLPVVSDLKYIKNSIALILAETNDSFQELDISKNTSKDTCLLI